MKVKSLSITCLILVSSLITFSQQEAIIINTIPSPVSSTRDMAWDGEYLWIGGSDEFQLFQLSPLDGSVIKTIPTNIAKPYGLTFDGSYLWVADNDNLLIQKVDPDDGTVLTSIPTPGDAQMSYPYGLAWDGNNLWQNDTKGPDILTPGDSTFRIDPEGNIIESYNAHGYYPTGLAFDGTYLWTSDNASNLIGKVDLSDFSIVDTIEAPGGNYPNGLTWDGEYLWVANNDSDSLYQVEVYNITSTTSREDNRNFTFECFPNPAKNKFRVQGSGFWVEKYRIELFDLNGRKLLQKDIQEDHEKVEVDISWLESGIYYCKISTEENTTTKKLIIQN